EGVTIILDYVWALARPHIPERYIEEMKGIAEGSGVPYEQIYQVLFCFVLIGLVIAFFVLFIQTSDNNNNNNNKYIHIYNILYICIFIIIIIILRALDWDTNGPFQQFPVVLVYHPTDGGHPFSVVSLVIIAFFIIIILLFLITKKKKKRDVN
ncbi:hypothetical protein RFI_26746, partial [Reticulomyxa filosa]